MANTPNMNLPLAVPGSTDGPDWAEIINQAMQIIDQHTHIPGSGVQITPDAININDRLQFNNQNAEEVAGLYFQSQNSQAGVGGLNYRFPDLYFTDGAGNDIRITQNGGIAGSPGSIANLTSPASASYSAISQTFVWQSDANIAANLDAGSLLMRNLTPNSTYALTLQPPSGLGANYSITLPSLPASSRVVSLSSTGVLATGVSSTVQSSDMASNSVATAAIQDGAVTQAKRAALGQQVSSSSGGYTVSSLSAGGTYVTPTNLSVTITTTGRPVQLRLNTGWLSIVDVNGFYTDNAFGCSFFRGSTQLQSDVYVGMSAGPNDYKGLQVYTPATSFSYVDTPAAGTYTYTFKVLVPSPSSGNEQRVYVTNTILMAYEL